MLFQNIYPFLLYLNPPACYRLYKNLKFKMFSSELKSLAHVHFNNKCNIFHVKQSLGDLVSNRTLQRWFKKFKDIGQCVISKSTGRLTKSHVQLEAIKIKMKYRKNNEKKSFKSFSEA